MVINKVSGEIHPPAVIYIIPGFPLICNRSVKILTLGRTIQSLCYKCQCCRRHCTGVVVSLSSAETRPSIRAVQRCFVRSNSISEFLYRTHHISKQTPGQCALRCLHKAKHTHNTAGIWEQTLTHSLPVALTTTLNESLLSIQKHSKVNMLPNMKLLLSCYHFIPGGSSICHANSTSNRVWPSKHKG